ncbi:MAG TPA: short-chain dehydrogenase, partial [Gammaproteobacteria bacterium]|nr:short-chain dehydrogenase [Gammaproteobacteria bacterium]
YVTFPTWLFGGLKRLLPHSLLDKILLRISRGENR